MGVDRCDEDLGSSEDVLDEIGRLAKVGAWMLDVTTGRGSWTAVTARMHEMDPGVPMDFAGGIELYQGESRVRVERAIREAIELRRPFDIEIELVTPSGVRKHVRSIGRPIVRDDRVVVVRGTFQDVTELRRAEDARRRGDELLRLFVESAPGAVAMFDRDLRYLALSRRFLVDLDMAEQELLGRRHYDLFPDLPERWRDVHRRCLAGATERCTDDPWTRADGRIDWITWEIRPWHDGDGSIGGIILFSEVVTERKRAELAAREREHRFRAIFEQSPIGKAMIDPVTSRFTQVNATLCAIAGRTSDEMLALRWSDLVHADDVAAGVERMDALIEGRIATYSRELRLVRPDDKLVWARVTVTPFELADSGEHSLVAVVEDITDLHETDAQVRAMFDTVPVGIAMIEEGTGRITNANARLAAMLGYTRDELLADSIGRLTHPGDRDRTMALVAEVRSGRQRTAQMEKRYLRKDGSVMWADLRMTALTDGAGQYRNMVVTIDDITERRAAETAHRLQTTALEAAANGILITDASGVIEWVNPAFTALTGYAADEVVGNNPRLLSSASQDRAFYAQLWSTIRAGEVWHGELVNRRKDGTLYHEDQTITPVRGPDGTISHFIAIKQDITARRRAETIVRESEARLRAAFAGAPIPIALARLDGEVLFYNAAFTESFGYTHHDTPTVDAWMARAYPDPVDRARMTAQWADELATSATHGAGAPARIYAVTGKDGRVHDVQIGGRVVGDLMIAVFDDVTEQRRAEDALRASEERYRTLVDSLDDVVFSVDLAGTLTYVNRAVKQYGYRVEDCTGRPMTDFAYPDDRALMIDAARRRLAGSLEGPVEYRLRDATGAPRNVRVMTRVAPGGGLAGIIVDVTAQRRTEEQLRAAQKMEAIGRLAGGVAHDFNNILTVILSFSELAHASVRADDPLRDDLDEIIQATTRAAGLTRQLLAFSRRQVLQPEPVDLDELVASIGKMLHRIIGEDIELLLQSSNVASSTMVDRGQIEQVVMNLVVNARDAMPDGGRLTIATAPVVLDAAAAQALDLAPGPYVRLAVIDSGTGMDAATRARVFEPFFTTKEQGKGTGLGLSTVYGIVKQSRGGISIESAPGAGSTFTIYLPSGGDDVVRASSARKAAPQRGHETVLIVEDEVQLRTAVVRVLTAAGYRTLVAPSPSEALRLAAEQGASVNLIFTDVVMPEMNGRELATRLRPLCPSARILYTSGYTDDALVRSGVLGEEFLPKPYDPVTLSSRIRALLDAR